MNTDERNDIDSQLEALRKQLRETDAEAERDERYSELIRQRRKQKASKYVHAW